MQCIVVGGGRLAAAVATSLQAQGRQVVMTMRDKELVQQARVTGELPISHSKAPLRLQVEESSRSIAKGTSAHPIRVESFEEGTEISVETTTAIVVCVPSAAIAETTERCVIPLLRQALGTRQQRDAETLQQLEHQVTEKKMGAEKELNDFKASRKRHLPPLLIGARGLSAAGDTQYEVLRKALSLAGLSGCSDTLSTPLFSFGGPFVADEWRRAASAYDAEIQADNDKDCLDNKPRSTMPPPPVPVNLLVGGAFDASMASTTVINRLFGREVISPIGAVQLEEQHDAARSVGVLEACAMITSWTAALVSRHYFGLAPSSALGCLSTYAAEGTCELLEVVMGLKFLPLGIAACCSSRICIAATQLAPETAMGRRDYDYSDPIQFDAMNRIQRDMHRLSLDQTMEGMKNLLKRHTGVLQTKFGSRSKATTFFGQVTAVYCERMGHRNELAEQVLQPKNADWFTKDAPATDAMEDMFKLTDVAVKGSPQEWMDAVHEFRMKKL